MFMPAEKERGDARSNDCDHVRFGPPGQVSEARQRGNSRPRLPGYRAIESKKKARLTRQAYVVVTALVLQQPDADNSRLAPSAQEPLEHASHAVTSSPSSAGQLRIQSKSLCCTSVGGAPLGDHRRIPYPAGMEINDATTWNLESLSAA